MAARDKAVQVETSWVSNAEMAALLAISTRTLQRMRAAGHFKEGHHYRRKNPLARLSDVVWHRERTMLRMNAL